MKRQLIFDFIEIAFLFILIVVPVRFFITEPFLVRGESMEPNFHNWDYLVIDKLSFFLRDPKRGEIIIFHPPFDDKVFYIKRVIGLPGERIVINENKIMIFNEENSNGFVLEEDYLQNHYTSGKIDLTLGKNEYFVLGDNREVSYDSRKWGPVKRERIIGRVILKIPLLRLTEALIK